MTNLDEIIEMIAALNKADYDQSDRSYYLGKIDGRNEVIKLLKETKE